VEGRNWSFQFLEIKISILVLRVSNWFVIIIGNNILTNKNKNRGKLLFTKYHHGCKFAQLRG
jgi:hypothetical protein